MKDVGKLLKEHIENNCLDKKELAEALGVNFTYFYTILRKPTIDCGLLEQLCKLLKLSPMMFFDVDVEGGNEINVLSKNSAGSRAKQAIASNVSTHDSHAAEIIKEKERIIASQAETISLLKQVLNLRGNGTDSGQGQ